MHDVCACVLLSSVVVLLPKGECWNVCVGLRAFLFAHSTFLTWHADVSRRLRSCGTWTHVGRVSATRHTLDQR